MEMNFLKRLANSLVSTIGDSSIPYYSLCYLILITALTTLKLKLKIDIKNTFEVKQYLQH